MPRTQCTKTDCFGNICGSHCKVLDRPITDHACPFYKTFEELEEGRSEAYAKVLGLENRDEILQKYYEDNPGRKDW